MADTRGMAGATCWVVTDGKAGDLGQCLGIAECLGLSWQEKTVRPRPPWSWFAPFGPPDPRDLPGDRGVALPDVAIASGRRAVPVLRAVKQASHGRTFSVFLKMPANGRSAADVIWVPEHDPLRGDNVIVTLTSPSRLTPALLQQARRAPDPRIQRLPVPRVALVLGGPGAGYVFDRSLTATLVAIVRQLLGEGRSLMITPSRRTPAALTDALAAVAREGGAASRFFLWQGEPPNPYASMLGLADALIVTADSANMLGEAVLTGAPVHIVEPSGGRRKMRRFVERLVEEGVARRWAGRLEAFSYVPLDATPVIAAEIAARYAAFRRSAG